ncbi:hypothetical protein [Rhodophyticola porphyridii]|uniref:hypothetical protein n=1 Tax=Rhodophyticola porphyridii TaxID=1852017 RepID=UPI0011C46215|nr:hypothetical protein [Rhodophyticola porphyridii]
MTFRLLPALALAFFGTSAFAQSLDGASIVLEQQHYDDGGGFTVTSREIGADIAFAFNGGFGMQLGFAHSSETDSSDPFLDFQSDNSYALHLFYDASDAVRLGVLAAADTFNDGDRFLGIEGIFLNDRVRAEARIGRFISDVEPANLYELHGAYALTDRVRLLGMLRRVDFDDSLGHYNLGSLGFGFGVTESAEFYAIYARHENDFGTVTDVYNGDVVSFGLRVTFGPRNDRMFTYTPFY